MAEIEIPEFKFKVGDVVRLDHGDVSAYLWILGGSLVGEWMYEIGYDVVSIVTADNSTIAEDGTYYCKYLPGSVSFGEKAEPLAGYTALGKRKLEREDTFVRYDHYDGQPLTFDTVWRAMNERFLEFQAKMGRYVQDGSDDRKGI